MGPWERLLCSPGAAFLLQAFQKQVSWVNLCVLGFFGGTQGCSCLVQHSGNQEISSHLGCSAETGEVIILPSIKKIPVLTYLYRCRNSMEGLCAPECWTVLLVKQESIPCVTL